MVNDDQLLNVLRSIDRRLALLTGGHERDVRERLFADILRTPSRLRMFDCVDGRTGSPDLAKAAGVSERAAQQFVKDLLDLGLVKVIGGTTGRGFIVARDDDAIVQWYLQAVAKDADSARPPSMSEWAVTASRPPATTTKTEPSGAAISGIPRRLVGARPLASVTRKLGNIAGPRTEPRLRSEGLGD